MTNQDIGAHPRVDQWSNGTDAAAELTRMMEVRRAALARFGENAIRRGSRMAQIEEVLVPLYLHHRYQVEAAASRARRPALRLRAARRRPRADALRARRRSRQAALEALLPTLEPSELRAARRRAARRSRRARRATAAPRALPALHRPDVRRGVARRGGGGATIVSSSSTPSARRGSSSRQRSTLAAGARRRDRRGCRGHRSAATRARVRGRDRARGRARGGGAADDAWPGAPACRRYARSPRSACGSARAIGAAHAQLLADDIKRFLERPCSRRS